MELRKRCIKDLERYRETCERTKFDAEYIQIEGSDFIDQDNGYKNLMTGKEGKNIEDVIRDKPFIIGSKKYISMQDYFFATQSKQDDVLIIVPCKMVEENGICKWTENMLRKRILFSLKYKFVPSFEEKELMDIWYKGVHDISGQAVIHEELQINLPVGLKKEFLSYLGGVVQTYGMGYIEAYSYEENILRIISDILKYKNNKECGNKNNKLFKIGLQDYFTSITESGDMPEEVLGLMKRRVRNLFMKNEKAFLKNLYQDNSILSVSYIQQVGDVFMERIFCPVIWPKYPFSESEVELIEYARIEMNPDCYYRFSRMVNERNRAKRFFPYILILCCDESLKESGLNTAGDYLLWPILEKIKEKENAFDGDYTFLDMSNETPMFPKEYDAVGAGAKMTSLAYNPIIEKVFKVIEKIEGKSHYIHDLIMDINYRDFSKAQSTSEKIFGMIDNNAKSLNKTLMIPKGMLDYIIKNDMPLNFIKMFKSMCHSEEEMEYFMNMNQDDYTRLLEWFHKNSIGVYEHNTAFISLTALNGLKSWKNYLDFFEKHYSRENTEKIVDYQNYLNAAVSLKNEFGIEKPWKVYGESLEKAMVEAVKIKFMKKDLSEFKEGFEKYQSEWKELEFEDDDYMVIAASSPVDVIVEGTILRHCAADFVKPMARNDTALLFLRKKDKPDKPYYTIEVRNGCIRQCHGFSNTNVDMEDPKLFHFIEKFSEEKNLFLDYIDEPYGP